MEKLFLVVVMFLGFVTTSCRNGFENISLDTEVAGEQSVLKLQIDPIVLSSAQNEGDIYVEGESLTLSVKVISKNATEINWQFSKLQGDEFINLNSTKSTHVFNNLDAVSHKGYYRVHVVEILNSKKNKDYYGEAVYIDIVKDTVVTTNLAPTVNAGSEQTLKLDAILALAADVSDDNLPSSPGQVSITWSKTSGPGVVTFSSSTTRNTNVTFDKIGTYILSIKADDGELNSTDSINVTVTANTPPSGLPVKPRGIISTSGKRKPIAQKVLEHSYVDGFMILDGWNTLETSEGVFDFSHIDSEVARAKTAGKVVRLAIHAGGDSAPTWLFTNYPSIKKVIWYNKKTGAIEYLPAYWDATFIEVKKRFYEALGKRYENESTVFAMSASMIDPNTGDWSFIVQDEAQLKSYIDSGYTDEKFVTSYKLVLDYAMSAFKNKYVVTAVGPVPRQLSPNKYSLLDDVLEYAFLTYGDRLIIAKGSLQAATPLEKDAIGSGWELMSRYMPHAAGQFVWGVTNDPEYKMNGKSPYSDKVATFKAAADIGKTYNLSWIEPWSIDILNPELQEVLMYASELFKGE